VSPTAATGPALNSHHCWYADCHDRIPYRQLSGLFESLGDYFDKSTNAQVPESGCKDVLHVVLLAASTDKTTCYMLSHSNNNCKCSGCLWLQAKKCLCSFCNSHWTLLLPADVPIRMQQQLKRRPQSCAATSKEPLTKSKVEGTTFWLLPQVRTSCTYHKSMQCKFDVPACCKLHLAATGWQEPAAVGQNT